MAAPFTSSKSRRARPQGLDPASVHQFVEDLVGEDLHAQRVLSLANGVVGVLHAASLAIHAIGLGLASAMGLAPTHTTRQVDRLPGNVGVDPRTGTAPRAHRRGLRRRGWPARGTRSQVSGWQRGPGRHLPMMLSPL